MQIYKNNSLCAAREREREKESSPITDSGTKPAQIMDKQASEFASKFSIIILNQERDLLSWF